MSIHTYIYIDTLCVWVFLFGFPILLFYRIFRLSIILGVLFFPRGPFLRCAHSILCFIKRKNVTGQTFIGAVSITSNAILGVSPAPDSKQLVGRGQNELPKSE